VRVKPGDSAADAVALVLGFDEVMALVFVNDELRFDAERFQRVPKFVGLRRGALAVAVADDDKRGRLDLFNEGDGRAFGINVGIVVNGFAEKWNHPLIDFVFAVVALVICDARAGHGGFEATGLRYGPHGHIAAVTPASEAEAIGINGRDFQRFIDAGQNIAKVTLARVKASPWPKLPRGFGIRTK